MKATFRTYCGTAGDLQTLLIADSESGLSESVLVPRTGWFKHYRMQRAKKKLLKKLEVLTGKKHIEKL